MVIYDHQETSNIASKQSNFTRKPMNTYGLYYKSMSRHHMTAYLFKRGVTLRNHLRLK